MGRYLPILLAAALAPPSGAAAQHAGELIVSTSAGNAALYLAPLAEALARALATGVVPSLEPRSAFDLSLGVRVIGAWVPEERKAFDPLLPGTLSYGGTVHQDPFQRPTAPSPTVAAEGAAGPLFPRAGSSFEAALRAAGEDPAAFALALPRGLGLSGTWIPLVEATLGLGKGTELVGRFAPTVTWREALGDASVFGATLLHTLDPYLGLAASPLDVRLTGALQRVRAGGYLEVYSSSVGAAAGGRFGQLELYLHGRIEDARTRIAYAVTNARGNPALPVHQSRVDTLIASSARGRVGLGAVFHSPSLALAGELSPGDGLSWAARLTLALPRRGGTP